MTMTQREFRNALCILRAIDRHELVERGIILSDGEWTLFRDGPYHAFLVMAPLHAEAVWTIIEDRSPR